MAETQSGNDKVISQEVLAPKDIDLRTDPLVCAGLEYKTFPGISFPLPVFVEVLGPDEPLTLVRVRDGSKKIDASTKLYLPDGSVVTVGDGTLNKKYTTSDGITYSRQAQVVRATLNPYKTDIKWHTKGSFASGSMGKDDLIVEPVNLAPNGTANRTKRTTVPNEGFQDGFTPARLIKPGESDVPQQLVDSDADWERIWMLMEARRESSLRSPEVLRRLAGEAFKPWDKPPINDHRHLGHSDEQARIKAKVKADAELEKARAAEAKKAKAALLVAAAEVPTDKTAHIQTTEYDRALERSNRWADRLPRLVGAMAALAVLATVTSIALLSPKSKPNYDASAVKANNSASVAPVLTTEIGQETLEEKRLIRGTADKGQETKPKIDPESGKEPWTVFANAVGPNNAKDAIIGCIQKLEAMGFRFELRNNPYKDHDWGINAIVGPDGKVYGKNKTIIGLLASVY